MTPYYDHAGIRIYHGDCREVLGCLPVAVCRACNCELTDESILSIHLAAGHAKGHSISPPVGLLLTDPPYEGEAHTQQRRIKTRGGCNVWGVTDYAPLPFAPMTERLRLEFARYSRRLAARWVLTFCQVEAAPRWRKQYERFGLAYKRTCIWVKPDGQPQGVPAGMGGAIRCLYAPKNDFAQRFPVPSNNKTALTDEGTCFPVQQRR